VAANELTDKLPQLQTPFHAPHCWLLLLLPAAAHPQLCITSVRISCAMLLLLLLLLLLLQLANSSSMFHSCASPACAPPVRLHHNLLRLPALQQQQQQQRYLMPQTHSPVLQGYECKRHM
jgi:hypothetical protein